MENPEKKKKMGMKINLRRLPGSQDTFEFVITTPTLKSQFILPRAMLNQLRIMIEKLLVKKD